MELLNKFFFGYTLIVSCLAFILSIVWNNPFAGIGWLSVFLLALLLAIVVKKNGGFF